MSVKYKDVILNEVLYCDRKDGKLIVFETNIDGRGGRYKKSEITAYHLQEEFLSEYRKFLRKNKDPSDRLIRGIDDCNEHGVFDLDVEQKSITKVMSLEEQLQYDMGDL